MNTSKIKASKKAFTLIELLVVIAIIALLLSILLPSLGLAKKYAKTTVCATSVRRIGLSMNLYAQDNRDWYPRALPLTDVNGNNIFDRIDWDEPWPSSVCPLWQAGYPSLLAPYLTDVQIADPFDYPSLPSQMGDSFIDFFRCPGNRIKREPPPFGEPEPRHCNYPLDYGLHNYASQDRQGDRDLRGAYLVADQTWAMAYVSGSDSSALSEEPQPDLDGWWNAFVHPKETLNVLLPDFSAERFTREKFIIQFKTATPPADDL